MRPNQVLVPNKVNMIGRSLLNMAGLKGMLPVKTKKKISFGREQSQPHWGHNNNITLQDCGGSLAEKYVHLNLILFDFRSHP